jgi:hypothetical protein
MMSPISAVFFVLRPVTLIVRISLAPVLSATVNLDSCLINVFS